MRIPGRSAAVLAALVSTAALAALSGCTVRPADADGKHHLPVRIELPSSHAPTATRSAESGGAGESSGRAASTPAARPAGPAPRVLWSRGDSGTGVRELQASARVAVAVVPTDEELEIATQTYELVGKKS
ncbi:hypothetical protein ACN6LA_004268 [Streptomyces sp. SAS_269]|uniref:hypothetical protein n=1 Tax=Streptomyces sp. SAS_269 TaxID=3412749 RepID=UPI00403CBA3F